MLDRSKSPLYPQRCLTWCVGFAAAAVLGAQAFVPPSPSTPSQLPLGNSCQKFNSPLLAYRDAFSHGDQRSSGGNTRSSGRSEHGDRHYERESISKELGESGESTRRSSSANLPFLSKNPEDLGSTALRESPSLFKLRKHGGGPESSFPSSRSFSSSTAPLPPLESLAGGVPGGYSTASSRDPPRPSPPSNGRRDSCSLSPASLAAAIHQIVRELTTPPKGPGAASPEAAAKRLKQKKLMEKELGALLAVAERNAGYLSPEAVTTIINALSKLPPRGLRSVVPLSASFRPLREKQEKEESGGRKKNHVAEVFAVAKGEAWPSPTVSLLPALLARALEVVHDMSPRCVATTVNSLARFRSSVAPFSLPIPPYLLTGLSTQAQRFLVKEEERGEAGKEGGKGRTRTGSGRGGGFDSGERFTPQGLSNIINGFARLGYHPGRRFLELFCEEQLSMMEELGPQNLANTINALGKLGFHPGTRFLERIAARAEDTLPEFNTQGLSNIINGFARLSPPFHPGPAFLDALRDASFPCLHVFESRGLAALAHGFSTLGHHPGNEYLDAVGEAMGRHLERASEGREGMTGWTLSTLYNGLARLDWRPGTNTLREMGQESKWSPSLPPTEAADTPHPMGGDAADAITDLSGLDWRAPSSTSPSSSGGDRGREGGKGRREPTGQRLWTSTAAWLVAQGQGETRWGDVLEPQQLTQLLWSLAIMGPPVEAEGLFRRLLGSAIARLGSPSTSPSAASLAGKGRAVDCEDGDCNVVPVHALRQLRQVARFVEVVLGWEGVEMAVGGSPEADKLDEMKQPTASSLLHMEVLRLLCRDLAAYDARTEVDDGVYVQDIVLMPKAAGVSGAKPSLPPPLPVIVEVDGPPHFFNNVPRRSRGDHKLKARILEAQTGKKNGGVVSVTWWEWVCRTRRQRTRMMVRKLVEVGVTDPSLYLRGVAALSLEEEAEEEKEEFVEALSFEGEDDEGEWMSYSDDEDDEDSEAADGGLIQAKARSLLQQKQERPQSMIIWGREDGGHLYNAPSSARLSPEGLGARIESEEESLLWSLTVPELKAKLREKRLPVSGVKAALVSRLMNVLEAVEEGGT
ncbi:hypothetical protein NSK_006163 [Nannochloropsis salina CCMP1776]|uniref:SAP domain-containing protein n=1 Tax=Nannochloropsis salina CCMP1776 TaxID=1027361 RepID=A0A4D9CY67_9STRA|nr:hypothetical protein NSK_006163 [Nannochloropsis salina CCMP1776]|eukprot:TFJ82533.1 hypothetical protein NSK_006163 [Nannochloropsis salina CCMP1776]